MKRNFLIWEIHILFQIVSETRVAFGMRTNECFHNVRYVITTCHDITQRRNSIFDGYHTAITPRIHAYDIYLILTINTPSTSNLVMMLCTSVCVITSIRARSISHWEFLHVDGEIMLYNSSKSERFQ